MDDHRLNAESRIQSITEPPLLEPSKPRTARPIAWSILICAILCVIAAIIIPFLTKQTITCAVCDRRCAHSSRTHHIHPPEPVKRGDGRPQKR